MTSRVKVNETPLAAPHARRADEILASLDVSPALGLTEDDVRRRVLIYGPNTVVTRRKAKALIVLAHQFRSPVVYLLGAAAAVALYFGEIEEGIAISVVLVINALIGFLTELKAMRSIEALRALGTHSARVRRAGHTRVIPAIEMVPGDIVLIEAGDSVSADLRLIEASNIAADESTLTGESNVIEKSTQPVSKNAPLAEHSSMLFKGTTVTRGTGIGVVTAIGSQTEIGRISELVAESEPGASPLEQKLARLSGQLIWVTLLLTVLIAVVGAWTGEDVYLILQAAIALAVAAIPEGLPIVATLALARGMWRMAQQNALIERLSAVETLGATTLILADKTGTLTENRMTARRLWLPSGEVDLDGKSSADGDRQLAALIEASVLCNSATLGRTEKESGGDPMELALLRMGRRFGYERHKLLDQYPLVGQFAFDTTTKMMATVHRHNGMYLFVVKGAPEAVLAAATRVMGDDGDITLSEAERDKWLARVEDLGHRGFRVLACATKTSSRADAPPYEHLTLLGLIGLEDPTRADVPEAIRACGDAGIRVVMATGDHAITARSIGRAVGLDTNFVMEGRQLGQFTGKKKNELLKVGIFARVSPAEKLDLVRLYQAAGEIVAMTGDGVNDAPALRQADIGVAMGMRGTDVAREAAAMILLDDAFPTIVKAVREGRIIFGNIRRFVAYLLSCNLSEVLVVGLAILSTLPLPLMPLQILYLNLVTDVFPAFALAMGEGERDVLTYPPRNPREPILGRPQWVAIVMQSLTLTAATFGALALARLWLELDSRAMVTVSFLTLAFAQLWHVFNMRNPASGIFRNEVTRNPWIWGALLLCVALLVVPPYVPAVAYVLHLVPPSSAMWVVIATMSLAPLILIQAAAAIVTFLQSRPAR